jgi:hypothetical protein
VKATFEALKSLRHSASGLAVKKSVPVAEVKTDPEAVAVKTDKTKK